MDKKSLEEKLVFVKKKVENILREGELCKTDYMHKLDYFLKEENVIYGNGKATSPITKHVGERLILENSLSYFKGLEKDYVSLTNMLSFGQKAKEDIDKYNKLYELTKMYMTNNFNTAKITKNQFKAEAIDYLFSQPEMEELDTVRREFVGVKIVEDIIKRGSIKFSTKSEGCVSYGSYTIFDINSAFESIKKGNGIK